MKSISNNAHLNSKVLLSKKSRKMMTTNLISWSHSLYLNTKVLTPSISKNQQSLTLGPFDKAKAQQRSNLSNSSKLQVKNQERELELRLTFKDCNHRKFDFLLQLYLQFVLETESNSGVSYSKSTNVCLVKRRI